MALTAAETVKMYCFLKYGLAFCWGKEDTTRLSTEHILTNAYVPARRVDIANDLV